MDLEQTPENGQVAKNTPFGNLIYRITSFPSYNTFLEVGTWKGNGTTRCIVDAIQKRIKDEEKEKDIHFWSLEANEGFYKTAKDLWDPFHLDYLHLMYGKLHENGLLKAEEIEQHPFFERVRTHFDLWYEKDCEDYEKAPLIKDLPEQIDVLILDGGEFSGYADWLALKTKQPNVVCLDDTLVMKNEQVYRELKADPKWILTNEGNDRLGWAIFVRNA